MADQSLVSGIDRDGADTEVRPQDDFYRAMHGRWLDEFEIPEDKAEYASFVALHDQAQEQLRDIIVELSQQEQVTDEAASKIAALYASFMDTAARDAAGIAPLEPVLAQIEALSAAADLSALIGAWDRDGLGGPLGTFVHQDNMDSTRYLLDLRQSGLGLPDRDYYLDDKFAEVLNDYRAHIAQMWQLADFGDAQHAADAADRIIALESALAQAQWDRVRNRDPQATYNLMSRDQIEVLAPDLRIAELLDAVGVDPAVDEVNVGQPDYVQTLAALLSEVPLRDWQDYLRWHALSGTASLLSSELDQANFAFYGTRLRGIPSQRPMWKRGVDLVQSAMPEALGQVYVQRHFPPAHKERMVELVENLLAAFGEAISELEWMSETTKEEARAKLATFRAKIGYPDRWRDYSELEVEPTDLVGNVRRAAQFEHDYQVGKLGGEVDREEWFMPPQTVNAYYNPEMNEIVFPAAILQPPFFTMAADDAVNYGGIGAVIGHEISHGFDDKGSQYDGEGNLRNWWTETDHEAFAERTAALVSQYAQYEPVDGHRINGELTLGENIADLSGLAVAFRAYQRSLDGVQAPEIDGMTGAQRFFAGWAQVWRAKTRPEETIRRVATDPHSPPEYRVVGSLVNNDDFVDAYGVGPGDKMWRDPEDRVRIW